MAEEELPNASGEIDPEVAAAAQAAAEAPMPDALDDPAPPANIAAPAPVAQTSAPQSPTIEAPSAVATLDAPAASDSSTDIDEQRAIEELLKQATFEDPQSVARALPPTSNLDLPNFSQIAQEAQTSSIDLLRDVDLNVKIELGRSQMLVEDVLKLGEGSVVELDKLAGDPVDVFVNERLVARGEVLVLNDNFCVRINEIVAGVKEEGL